jgi:hypothetical protein
MLVLPDTVREVFIACGTLTFDDEKALVFAGLTVAESEFFLAHISCSPHERGRTEDVKFLELQRRHLDKTVKLWWELSK